VLAPGQIATPIRGILRRQKNATVILGEVTGVDKDKKCVFFNDADRENVPVPYDYLVLATGVTQSYFGHNEFAQYAPGLKTWWMPLQFATRSSRHSNRPKQKKIQAATVISSLSSWSAPAQLASRWLLL